jgi:hypothetical protein
MELTLPRAIMLGATLWTAAYFFRPLIEPEQRRLEIGIDTRGVEARLTEIVKAIEKCS